MFNKTVIVGDKTTRRPSQPSCWLIKLVIIINCCHKFKFTRAMQLNGRVLLLIENTQLQSRDIFLDGDKIEKIHPSYVINVLYGIKHLFVQHFVGCIIFNYCRLYNSPHLASATVNYFLLFRSIQNYSILIG